jgi:nucleoside-diphosphate-sugar epimerase
MVRILADSLSGGNFLLNNLERPKEDVSATKCNSKKVANLLEFDNYTDLRIGIRQFADWLKSTEFSEV